MKLRKITIIFTISIVIIIGGGFGAYRYGKVQAYNNLITTANKYMDEGDYDKAKTLFEQSLQYKNDSNIQKKIQLAERLKEAKGAYDNGIKLMNDKKYSEAIEEFKKINKDDGNLFDNAQKNIQECTKQYIAQNTETSNNTIKSSKYDEVILDNGLQKNINIFMSNFAELPFKLSFQEGQIEDSQLILFGFWHNYRNNYHKEPKHFEKSESAQDELKKGYVEEAIKKYFNISEINNHSVEYKGFNLSYQDGYYYQMHGDGDSPIDYSVVYKMEPIGDNKYNVLAKNYHTSGYYGIALDYDVYYSLNLSKAEEIYKNHLKEYEADMVTAKVEKINENGNERYILLEYKSGN